VAESIAVVRISSSRFHTNERSRCRGCEVVAQTLSGIWIEYQTAYKTVYISSFHPRIISQTPSQETKKGNFEAEMEQNKAVT
jgi:hypothetical protein